MKYIKYNKIKIYLLNKILGKLYYYEEYWKKSKHEKSN